MFIIAIISSLFVISVHFNLVLGRYQHHYIIY